MNSTIFEDSKVVGSATMAILIDYAQVFNQLITLLISFCTLIYVANRAYHSIIKTPNKRKKKKGKHK